MAKFDGIKGQELLDVEDNNNELTLIFKDNRFLFVKIENGKIVPRVEFVIKVSDLFKVTTDELIRDEMDLGSDE